MPANAPRVATVGTISLQLGVPVHRVAYVIRSRGIQPSATAGNLRIFSDADVQRIANELQRQPRNHIGASHPQFTPSPTLQNVPQRDDVPAGNAEVQQ